MVRMDANVMLNTKWACHVDFDNFHIDWMKGKRKDIPIVEAFIITCRSSMGLYSLNFTDL